MSPQSGVLSETCSAAGMLAGWPRGLHLCLPMLLPLAGAPAAAPSLPRTPLPPCRSRCLRTTLWWCRTRCCTTCAPCCWGRQVPACTARMLAVVRAGQAATGLPRSLAVLPRHRPSPQCTGGLPLTAPHRPPAATLPPQPGHSPTQAGCTPLFPPSRPPTSWPLTGGPSWAACCTWCRCTAVRYGQTCRPAPGTGGCPTSCPREQQRSGRLQLLPPHMLLHLWLPPICT